MDGLTMGRNVLYTFSLIDQDTQKERAQERPAIIVNVRSKDAPYMVDLCVMTNTLDDIGITLPTGPFVNPSAPSVNVKNVPFNDTSDPIIGTWRWIPRA